MLKHCLSICLLGFIISSSAIASYERSDSFVIILNDNSVKVLSPSSGKRNPGLIVRNKTLRPIRARIERNGKEILGHLNIPSRKDESIDLEYVEGTDLRFIPLSPPFQDVKLVLGRKAYEIPPKK